MRTRALVIAAATAATLAGCSSGFEGVSARDGCGDVWDAVCHRYYECYRADQIAEIGLPPTAEGCTQQLSRDNCDGFTDTACADGSIYHPGEVYPCSQAILTLDCALIADAPGTVPACDPVCGE